MEVDALSLCLRFRSLPLRDVVERYRLAAMALERAIQRQQNIRNAQAAQDASTAKRLFNELRAKLGGGLADRYTRERIDLVCHLIVAINQMAALEPSRGMALVVRWPELRRRISNSIAQDLELKFPLVSVENSSKDLVYLKTAARLVCGSQSLACGSVAKALP